MNRETTRALNAIAVRSHIADNGGLVGQGDLARLWEVSRPRVQEIINDPTFPEPVAFVGPDALQRALWTRRQAETWREVYFGVKRNHAA